MPWTWTRRGRLAGFCAVAVLLLVACIQFNNPVELEPDEVFGPKGSVTVEVTDIDPDATILVIELLWRETGVTGEALLRKTIALDGRFPELRFVFDGLGSGGGRASAGTYVGSYPWQAMVESPNIQLDPDAAVGTRILLGNPLHDRVPDFDRDIWGSDGDLPDGDVSDGDTDQTPADGDEDGDIDGDEDGDEDNGFDPERIVDVPYSPVSTDMNGRLNEDNQGENWDEWGYATRLVLQTELENPVTLYLMQNGVSLMIGADIPSLASDAEERDNIGFGLDLNPAEPGNAFVGVVWRRTAGKPVCEPMFPLVTCEDLPQGSPNWGVTQRETAYGWQLEMIVSLASLNIRSGQDKTLRFAVFNTDNMVTFTWPLVDVDRDELASWGRMHSSDLWDVQDIADGDEPDGDDPDGDDPDGDDPDGDVPDGDVPDGDVPDGDDPDGDEDGDIGDGDEDGDVDGDQGTFCAPGQLECKLVGSFWYAKQCNHDGSTYTSEVACNSGDHCKLDACLDGHGCYTTSNEGAPCDDGNHCTTNDQCVGGECQGTPVVCETRSCQTFTSNPAHPACCIYSNKANGIGCDDGYTCSNAECYNGECVSSWITGCCEGRPDMVRVKVGGVHFCIDRHEAVVGNQGFLDAQCAPTAPLPARRYGEFNDDYPAGFPDTVTYANQTTPLYACNASGNNPSRYLTYFQALTACQNVGKRLCSEAEYALACGGATEQTYPYGNAYNAATCNGEGSSVMVTGAKAACQRDGVYDLSGNMEEWVAEKQSQAWACGGGYGDFASDLTCSSCRQFSHTEANAMLGFRCCVNAPAGQ